MEDKSRLLTIGQFAGLHGINKKTLMWYDEIGLFRPAAVNPVNGYRYYNYHQSALLETILLLRELNASIDEIQDFMKKRSTESMRELIDEKIRELDLEMEHLRAVRKTLGNHRQNMDTLLSMDLADITVVEKETRCLVTVDIDQETSYDKQVEMITAETTYSPREPISGLFTRETGGKCPPDMRKFLITQKATISACPDIPMK